MARSSSALRFVRRRAARGGRLRHRLRPPAALRRHHQHDLARGLPPGAPRPRRRPDAAPPRRQRGGAGRRRHRRASPIRSSRSTRQWVYYSLLPRRAPAGLQLPARRPALRRRRHLPHPPRRRARSSGSPSASSRPTPAPATSTSRIRSTRRPASTASATASSISAPRRSPAARSPSPATATASCRRKGYTNPTLQLFVMDEDGAQRDADRADEHRQRAAPDAAARRPARCSARYETQGLRDSRMWGIWSIWPDGRALGSRS